MQSSRLFSRPSASFGRLTTALQPGEISSDDGYDVELHDGEIDVSLAVGPPELDDENQPPLFDELQAAANLIPRSHQDFEGLTPESGSEPVVLSPPASEARQGDAVPFEYARERGGNKYFGSAPGETITKVQVPPIDHHGMYDVGNETWGRPLVFPQPRVSPVGRVERDPNYQRQIDELKTLLNALQPDALEVQKKNQIDFIKKIDEFERSLKTAVLAAERAAFQLSSVTTKVKDLEEENERLKEEVTKLRATQGRPTQLNAPPPLPVGPQSRRAPRWLE